MWYRCHFKNKKGPGSGTLGLVFRRPQASPTGAVGSLDKSQRPLVELLALGVRLRRVVLELVDQQTTQCEHDHHHQSDVEHDPDGDLEEAAELDLVAHREQDDDHRSQECCGEVARAGLPLVQGESTHHGDGQAHQTDADDGQQDVCCHERHGSSFRVRRGSGGIRAPVGV